MSVVSRKSFDGSDVLARDFAHGDAAGEHRALADQHSTCSTLLDSATELSSGQTDRVPQRPEQRRFRFKVKGVLFFVDL